MDGTRRGLERRPRPLDLSWFLMDTMKVLGVDAVGMSEVRRTLLTLDPRRKMTTGENETFMLEPDIPDQKEMAALVKGFNDVFNEKLQKEAAANEAEKAAQGAPEHYLGARPARAVTRPDLPRVPHAGGEPGVRLRPLRAVHQPHESGAPGAPTRVADEEEGGRRQVDPAVMPRTGRDPPGARPAARLWSLRNPRWDASGQTTHGCAASIDSSATSACEPLPVARQRTAASVWPAPDGHDGHGTRSRGT